MAFYTTDPPDKSTPGVIRGRKTRGLRWAGSTPARSSTKARLTGDSSVPKVGARAKSAMHSAMQGRRRYRAHFV